MTNAFIQRPAKKMSHLTLRPADGGDGVEYIFDDHLDLDPGDLFASEDDREFTVRAVTLVLQHGTKIERTMLGEQSRLDMSKGVLMQFVDCAEFIRPIDYPVPIT